jgi:hypothetical protein
MITEELIQAALNKTDLRLTERACRKCGGTGWLDKNGSPVEP